MSGTAFDKIAAGLTEATAFAREDRLVPRYGIASSTSPEPCLLDTISARLHGNVVRLEVWNSVDGRTLVCPGGKVELSGYEARHLGWALIGNAPSPALPAAHSPEAGE